MFSQIRSRSNNKFQTRRGGLLPCSMQELDANGSLDATVKYAWVTSVERGNLRFQLNSSSRSTARFPDTFLTENLADHQAQALGANGRGGAVPAGSLRQIDHLDATDDVLERNIAYR